MRETPAPGPPKPLSAFPLRRDFPVQRMRCAGICAAGVPFPFWTVRAMSTMWHGEGSEAPGPRPDRPDALRRTHGGGMAAQFRETLSLPFLPHPVLRPAGIVAAFGQWSIAGPAAGKIACPTCNFILKTKTAASGSISLYRSGCRNIAARVYRIGSVPDRCWSMARCGGLPM